jgi:hypothetical protein
MTHRQPTPLLPWLIRAVQRIGSTEPLSADDRAHLHSVLKYIIRDENPCDLFFQPAAANRPPDSDPLKAKAAFIYRARLALASGKVKKTTLRREVAELTGLSESQVFRAQRDNYEMAEWVECLRDSDQLATYLETMVEDLHTVSSGVIAHGFARRS